MAQISLSIPQAGLPNATEDAKVATDLSTIQTWANGNVDSTNISAALAQAAAVNQGGQTVKGATNIATSESRTNTAYGTLTTPDQVTGIVLPSNGLIRVWYQATWQESISGVARAAIFLGSNQLNVRQTFSASSIAQAAAMGVAVTNSPLVTAPFGLVSTNSTQGGVAPDVTTGEAVGIVAYNGGSPNSLAFDMGGTAVTISQPTAFGGPCDIFAAAGTYTISVQFKASSGTVTASNRKLWCQALSFA